MQIKYFALLALLCACNQPTDAPKGDAPKAPASAAAAPASDAPVKESAKSEAAGAPASAAVASAAAEQAPKGEPHPALLDPSKATEQAPEKFAVKLETTEGEIIIDVDRALAPRGADRFYNLVKIGYYDDVAFFRVIQGFMVQLGIHGDGKVNAVWRNARIDDDETGKASNTRGMVSFATAGPNTRTSQFFINFEDNSRLDRMGFAPFGKVRDMAVVDKLYNGYGEGAPRGAGPDQGRMQEEGNVYLREKFPELDYVKKATILP